MKAVLLGLSIMIVYHFNASGEAGELFSQVVGLRVGYYS